MAGFAFKATPWFTQSVDYLPQRSQKLAGAVGRECDTGGWLIGVIP